MKIKVIVLLISISNFSFAQLQEGFDPNEAKACIAMCNSYTFQDLYDSDINILPEGYEKVFTSEVVGLDNMFQVYEKGEVGAINLRGLTSKFQSG